MTCHTSHLARYWISAAIVKSSSQTKFSIGMANDCRGKAKGSRLKPAFSTCLPNFFLSSCMCCIFTFKSICFIYILDESVIKGSQFWFLTLEYYPLNYFNSKIMCTWSRRWRDSILVLNDWIFFKSLILLAFWLLYRT